MAHAHVARAEYARAAELLEQALAAGGPFDAVLREELARRPPRTAGRGRPAGPGSGGDAPSPVKARSRLAAPPGRARRARPPSRGAAPVAREPLRGRLGAAASPRASARRCCSTARRSPATSCPTTTSTYRQPAGARALARATPCASSIRRATRRSRFRTTRRCNCCCTPLRCRSSATIRRGHHVVNVVLHALASVLLVARLPRVRAARAPPRCCGGAFFLAHPANVEAVAWISQLKSTRVAGAGARRAARLPAAPGARDASASRWRCSPRATRSSPCRSSALFEWLRTGRVRWRWIALWAADVRRVLGRRDREPRAQSARRSRPCATTRSSGCARSWRSRCAIS